MSQKLIFISHRTKDKSVGDMILDFLSATGIPRDAIKCSSLPGNDVKVNISSEVRDWIQHSVVNIAILSSDYYDSAYCLNEAGILWYLNEIPVIPIGLPKITHEKMIGFLNSDYKIRRLDSDDDIAYIYDAVQEALGISAAKHSVINTETKKLKGRYKRFCDDRVTHTAMGEEADEPLTYLEEEDLWVDGYHEVHDRDGNVIEKGQYLNGILVDGISYNIILKISKQKKLYEKPEPTEEEAGEFDGYDYDCWEIRNTEEPVALDANSG